MAIEHVIELPCEPKRRLGPEKLRALLRQVNRLHDDLPITEEEATEAVEAAFQLRPLAFHCTRCPANHAKREFGCVEWIPTPLSAAAERWLFEQLPSTLKLNEKSKPTARVQVTAVRGLVRRLRELGVRGAVVDARHRSAESAEALAELPRGLVRRYGFLGREHLSTGELIELFFLHERIEPATAELACRVLDVWIDGQAGPDGTSEAVFTQPANPGDDVTLAALKHFFHALMVACSLGVGVATEPQ